MNKILLVLFTIFIVLSIFYFSMKNNCEESENYAGGGHGGGGHGGGGHHGGGHHGGGRGYGGWSMGSSGGWPWYYPYFLIIHIIRVQIAHLHLLLHLHRMKRNKCLVKV